MAELLYFSTSIASASPITRSTLPLYFGSSSETRSYSRSVHTLDQSSHHKREQEVAQIPSRIRAHLPRDPRSCVNKPRATLDGYIQLRPRRPAIIVATVHMSRYLPCFKRKTFGSRSTNSCARSSSRAPGARTTVYPVIQWQTPQ